MRILILAGIHGNMPAFEAVLKDAKGKWDYVWCLGNIIGYGTEPNECIELLQTLPHLSVIGVFEWAVVGRCDLRTFNSWDRWAAEWTQNAIKPEHLAFLNALPTVLTVDLYTLIHGSPREPVWEYITDPLIAALNFPYLKTLCCLSGRVPYPAIYEQVSEDGETCAYPPRYNEPHTLNGKRKIIISGSVGIAGRGTPEYAEYGLLDTDKAIFEHCRCPYDLASVLSQLEAANFHKGLIKRWKLGYF